jgi:hypothetical protein
MRPPPTLLPLLRRSTSEPHAVSQQLSESEFRLEQHEIENRQNPRECGPTQSEPDPRIDEIDCRQWLSETRGGIRQPVHPYLQPHSRLSI